MHWLRSEAGSVVSILPMILPHKSGAYAENEEWKCARGSGGKIERQIIIAVTLQVVRQISDQRF